MLKSWKATHILWAIALCTSALGAPPPRTPPAARTPPTPKSKKIDREAVLNEIQDFTLEGMDRRLGPDYASYHTSGKAENFAEIYLAPDKQENGGRRYQIGGPWVKEAGDFSSTQGQILYVPEQGLGVDRVTILEWSNGGFSERPEVPWWGGFRPEPASAKWHGPDGGAPGVPIAMARGMGGWSNAGVIVFSSGLVGTAGTCTGRGEEPTLQLPPEKIPTAISVTNKNEFALITVCDIETNKGQVAVIALESTGKRTGFAHEWRDEHPGLPNVAVFSRMKLLGFVDLPGIEFPTGVCAVGNHANPRINGRDGNAGLLREFDLAQQGDRDTFYRGNNGDYVSTAGFAVVVGKHEGKAAFLDLQPLFQRLREMYFTTEDNYKKTRQSGPEPKQWPFTFEVDASWKPPVVKVLGVVKPTAVIASLTGGEKAGAIIASQDGKLGFYSVGGLATDAPASPRDIMRQGEIKVGRNPTCLAYQKGSPTTIIAVSRGDREIAWVSGSANGPQVTRRLRDERLLDPVHLEVSDTHGIETSLLTVADFKGRKILNYRYSQCVFVTQGGAKFGMGADGKDEYECGGIMEFPGSPFCISASNVN